MATWMIYATVAAVALAAADVFVKTATGRLPNSLATLIYGAVAFGVGLGWFLADRARGGMERASIAGVMSAIAVGVAFSLVMVALLGAFRAGAPLSVTSPFVRVSGVIVASICGVLIWNEPVTPRYVAGLCLATAGVGLIVAR